MEHLGQRIKRLRESRNYTQEFMANNLKISQNSYSRIESENVKLTTDRLKNIAQILDVPVELLITNEAPNFSIHNSTVDKYYGFINNLHEEQKEITQNSFRILEEQLKHLQQENIKLLNLLEKTIK
jgi:transcriptional regulator with XRE-family HTH domain